MLRTSFACSMSRLSHWPSEPAYYIEDCRIFGVNIPNRPQNSESTVFFWVFKILGMYDFVKHWGYCVWLSMARIFCRKFMSSFAKTYVLAYHLLNFAFKCKFFVASQKDKITPMQKNTKLQFCILFACTRIALKSKDRSISKESRERNLGQTPFSMITKITKTASPKNKWFWLPK